MSIDDLHRSPGVNAVVLSGGGANGAYEIGVLKALLGGASPSTNFMPIPPGEPTDDGPRLGVASGTSVGGLNAAALVSHLWESGLAAVTELEDIWLNMIPRDDSTNHNHVYRFRGNPFEFLNPKLALTDPLLPFKMLATDTAYFAQAFFSNASSLFKSGGQLEGKLANLIDFSSLITNEPASRLIPRIIHPRLLRSSNVQLRIASTNWDTGTVRIFHNWDMTDDYASRIVLSSTAIPGIFPYVEIDGDKYVDGGVLMNTPLLPAIRAGADTLHIIYLDPAVKSIPGASLHSTLDTLSRMYSIQFAAKMNDDIKRASVVNRAITTLESLAGNASPETLTELKKVAGVDKLRKVRIHRYHPRDDLGGGLLGWLDFGRERIAQLIERGFRDCVEHDCNRSQCVSSDGTVHTAVSEDKEG